MQQSIFSNSMRKFFRRKRNGKDPVLLLITDAQCLAGLELFLYPENVDELVDEMTESMEGLLKIGAKKIILACNTSHLFLPKIFERVPEAKSAVVNIIDSCVNQIDKDNIKQVYLLGSEGTIESEVYQKALTQKGIKCQVPEKEQYVLLRECIEAVKQNKYTDEVESIFKKLVGGCEMPVILGCTELPILYEKYKDNIERAVYDPLQIALNLLKKEYDYE